MCSNLPGGYFPKRKSALKLLNPSIPLNVLLYLMDLIKTMKKAYCNHVRNSMVPMTKHNSIKLINVIIWLMRSKGLLPNISHQAVSLCKKYFWYMIVSFCISLKSIEVNAYQRNFSLLWTLTLNDFKNVLFSRYVSALAPKFSTKNVRVYVDEIESCFQIRFFLHYFVFLRILFLFV